jgi:hypothetical protein
MKNCCGLSSGPILEYFDENTAESELKRYIQKGPNPTTRSLLAHIISAGTGTTVLDIGAGIAQLNLRRVYEAAHRYFTR